MNNVFKIKVKKNTKFSIFLGVISFIIAAFVLLNTDKNSGYNVYFMIPFIFGILLIIFPILNFFEIENVGPLVLSYTMIVKYMISPLISSLAKYESWLGVYPSESYIRSAIYYTVYELLAIYLVCFICTKHYEKKNVLLCDPKPMKKVAVHMLMVAVGFATFFAVPEAFLDYRFLFDQSDLANNRLVEFSGSGIFKTLFIFGRYSLVLLFLNYFYKRNQKKQNGINVVCGFIPVMLNCLFISNLSRISVLVPMIVGLVLILQLFKDKRDRRIGSRFAIIIGLSLVFFLSFMKFFGDGRGDVTNATSLAWWGDTLNMYFTGIKETAVGIKVIPLINSTYGINRFLLFFNDSFTSVSFLSNFTAYSLSSNVLYNLVYFGSNVADCQIVPNVCEGIYYFSGVFSALWPAVFVLLAYKFSYISKKQEYLDGKFVYVYSAIWCGLILMINTSMIIANCINISLLYAVVAFLNKSLRIKR